MTSTTTSRPLAGEPAVILRGYDPRDEDASIALWLRTWAAAFPDIDFAARLNWWRRWWREELVATTTIVIAETDGVMIGFVTVDPDTFYLDQIVVAPERWGTGVAEALIAEAKRISPKGLDLDVNTDNARAIRFYEKHGFVIGGAGKNPLSGKPIHSMSWRP
ncbi:MAG: GNAT family N-acetyltransferase [Xanthobacteraceae bacterium]|jgi:putative acetyltransferase